MLDARSSDPPPDSPPGPLPSTPIPSDPALSSHLARPGRAERPLDPALPAVLRARAVSAFVYGPSRTMVGLTLYAFARATNPEFLWVEVRVPGEAPERSDPVALGWVPEGRLVSLDRRETLRSDRAASVAAIASLLHTEEPDDSFDRVAEFLRLPDPSQRILARPPSDGTPGVVAVTNAHRLMAAYCSNRVPAILSAHLSAGYSVFVGWAETAGEGRQQFDYVFRLDGESARDWRESTITCEKGDDTGILRVGHSVRLPRLTFLERVFEEAIPDHGE